MTTRTTIQPRYLFPHGAPQEKARLKLMSVMLDPHTLFRIEELGLAPGWRCLEIGAGNGSVSRALCERVGERGRVVAVDLETELITAGAPANLEARRANILDTAFEEGAYDLVYTRAVLHHLPQWRQALQRMAAALRPGGAMLVQEPDMHPTEAAESGDWRAFWMGFFAWGGERGVDYRLGRKVPPALRELGFEEVRNFGETVHFAGGSDPAEFYRLSMARIRDELVASGHVSNVLFERFVALLADPGHWGMNISFMAASGRKPR